MSLCSVGRRDPSLQASAAPITETSRAAPDHRRSSPERTMADSGKTSDKVEKRFADMAFSEKLKFIGKALVFFVSGGFVFPTLWVD